MVADFATEGEERTREDEENPGEKDDREIP
jgi:hypothetical protein